MKSLGELLSDTEYPEQQPHEHESQPLKEPHRSLLGAALSMEYGPCSVAAAELSRAAIRLDSVPEKEKTIKKQVVVSTLDTPVAQYVRMTHISK